MLAPSTARVACRRCLLLLLLLSGALSEWANGCPCCRRIYMTIVAGAAVGILGIEGWGGFTVYLLSQLLVSVKAG